MKILLVNKFFFFKGGSETYFFALGKALEESGHEVIWFSMTHPDNLPCRQSSYFVDYVNYHNRVSPAKRLKNAASALYSFAARDKFDKLLQDERPDVVHINNIHKQITLSILDPCVKYNIPVVATVHDWIYVCANYQKLKDGVVCNLCRDGNVWHCAATSCVQGSKGKSILATVETLHYRLRGSYNKVDMYLSPSMLMTGEMRNARFLKSNITFMRNFLQTGEFDSFPDAALDYFLYAGRLEKEKGIHTLIRAFAKASPAQYLYIIGDGTAADELKKLAHSLYSSDKIKFLGFKQKEDCEHIMSGCLALIHPSEIMENCPYSIMEAMAMGKPVIGSRIGGIPELIIENKTGFCYNTSDVDDLADKILAISVLDKERYVLMSDAARKFARDNFSKRVYTNAVIDIYERLISSKGTPTYDKH